MEKQLQSVESFWNTEACGAHFVEEKPGTKEFYEKYRAFRYQTEWHIPEWIPFAESKGKNVLEIGCGNGADGVLFAQAGAHYTGVDLTKAAVEATRRHFEVLGFSGRFQVENAEALSFPDATFDWVYAYGALHHTANPAKAFEEVYRVLKPGGRADVMLYHKNSFNYYARIMGYMRLRLLWKILTSSREGQDNSFQGLRGNHSGTIWDIHHRNFLKWGWSYLKPENFVHHATDGPECPYAHVFTRKEMSRLFHRFRSVQCRVRHFPLRKYPVAKWVPKAVEFLLAAAFGWYLCVSLRR